MSNINKINSNPSFGSMIRISPKAFKEATALLSKNDGPNNVPWHIFDAKYLKKGYANCASYSATGVIKNADGDAFMFQAGPNENLCNLLENLDIAADNLKRPNQKLTGFLIGGNASYEPSLMLTEALQKIFNALNIKYSALLGQKIPSKRFPIVPGSDLYFNGAKNKYIVNFVNDANVEIHNRKDLEKYFDTIKIDSSDNLKF